MRSSRWVLVLGLLSLPGKVPVQAEARLAEAEERRHLGFILAQGASGETQPVLPRYTRDQGLLDGRLAAEFKGKQTRWFWAGYLSGFSTLGLLQFSDFAARSDTPLEQQDYRAVKEKGHDYVGGFREGYQTQIRARRKASVEEGRLWGICSLTGVLTLIVIDRLD